MNIWLKVSLMSVTLSVALTTLVAVWQQTVIKWLFFLGVLEGKTITFCWQTLTFNSTLALGFSSVFFPPVPDQLPFSSDVKKRKS